MQFDLALIFQRQICYTENDMVIEIKHIAKRFRKKQVLRDISFTAREGACIGILGSNGSGKSTLLSILAGVLKSDSGQFLCDGNDLLTDGNKRAELVGYVPQGTPLVEELTARDNLLMWYDRQDMEESLERGILSLLEIGEFLKTPVYKMSGGMKKRLSIGCAVYHRPPILLLDEPMAALDIACKKKISDYLKLFKAQGGIAVMVTHDLIEMELCDEHYVVKNGALEKIEFTGEVDLLVSKL